MLDSNKIYFKVIIIFFLFKLESSVFEGILFLKPFLTFFGYASFSDLETIYQTSWADYSNRLFEQTSQADFAKEVC